MEQKITNLNNIMRIQKYQQGTPNGGILDWRQIMLNVDLNYVPHFLLLRNPNQAQISSISQEEINRLRREKRLIEEEQQRSQQLSKSLHMWNWTGPLMNTSSTNRYNALSRFNFNKEAMQGTATVGLTAASAPALAPGGSFWTKGIQWLNPSRYLGKGSYTTALGGENTSMLGAIADNALVSYGGAEALDLFYKNPNFLSGIVATLAAGTPFLGRPINTKLGQLKIPEGFTFIREAELTGRDGVRKVHLVKDNITGKTKILEDLRASDINNSSTAPTSGKNIHDLFVNVATQINRLNLFSKLSANQLKEKEALIELLKPYLSGPQIRTFVNNVGLFLKKNSLLLIELENKAMKNAKRLKGSNAGIETAEAAERAKTPEGMLEAIRNEIMEGEKESIWKILSKSAEKTGIDWRDDKILNPSSYMNGMDTDLKLKTVGSNNEDPFIKRYYHNVIKHILNEGFLLKLLDRGELRYNKIKKQWEGLYPDGKHYKVIRPEEYVKYRYANDVKHANVELPRAVLKDGEWFDMIPIHGAGLGENNKPISKSENNWLEYLRKPSSAPGKNGYWTIIRDWLYRKSYAPGHYKQENYAVPFYTMPKYETENPFKPGNSYGLMNLIRGDFSGKIMRPLEVLDGVPGIINEYNYGPTFDHNPKSLWNTLDFAPGEGPMAYLKQNNNKNNLA